MSETRKRTRLVNQEKEGVAKERESEIELNYCFSEPADHIKHTLTR